MRLRTDAAPGATRGGPLPGAASRRGQIDHMRPLCQRRLLRRGEAGLPGRNLKACSGPQDACDQVLALVEKFRLVPVVPSGGYRRGRRRTCLGRLAVTGGPWTPIDPTDGLLRHGTYAVRHDAKELQPKPCSTVHKASCHLVGRLVGQGIVKSAANQLAESPSSNTTQHAGPSNSYLDLT
jgi:hypothetical protein